MHQPVQNASLPKSQERLPFYEFRMTIEKDNCAYYLTRRTLTDPRTCAPPRHTDARQAFENRSKVAA